MPSNKKRKKKVNQKELERRQRQSKLWHKLTHPNEEYEQAEKNRKKQSLDGYYSNDVLPLN